MRYRLLFIAFLLLMQPTVSAQQTFEEDIRESLKTKPRLDLRLDSRHTFISESGVRVIGIKAGLDFDRKLRLGIGYNQLWSELDKMIEVDGVVQNAGLRFYTFSPYVEYIFYRKYPWELSIPVQIGFGSSFYRFEEGGDRRIVDRKFVIAYEPVITAEYRLFKYFGPGFGIGYRWMIKNNRAIVERFTSPVYIFRLKFYFRELFDDVVYK